jgi:hypothetical protein
LFNSLKSFCILFSNFPSNSCTPKNCDVEIPLNYI